MHFSKYFRIYIIFIYVFIFIYEFIKELIYYEIKIILPLNYGGKFPKYILNWQQNIIF